MKAQEKPLVVGAINGSQNTAGTNDDSISKEHSEQEAKKAASSTSQSNLFFISPSIKSLEDEGVRDKLINAQQTDAGNAECFALLHNDHLRFCKSRNKWLGWDGFKWKVDTDGEAQRRAIITVRARKYVASFIKDEDKRRELQNWANTSESLSKRRAMLDTAKHLNPIEANIDMFDKNPLKVGVKNGTLNLETLELEEAKREDYISKQLNVEFNPQANAPTFRKFIDDIFAGDQELISYIQRAVGYSITGDTSEQVVFICHGNGANGKSVFLDALSSVLGDYADNCSFSTFEGNKRNDATNDLAKLKGKRFVTVIETDEDKRLAEARVKSVTGQDSITCRYLYCEYFSYQPEFKIWMAVNHKPLIKGTDRGIWRRIKLIPFTRNFEKSADPYLAQKLKTESSGILNWMLEGCKEWKEKRLGTARAIEIASEAYKKESDLVQQWLEERTLSDSNSNTSCFDAYISFKEWCAHRKYPEFSMNSFGRVMSEKGYERKSNGKNREYIGLKIESYDII